MSFLSTKLARKQKRNLEFDQKFISRVIQFDKWCQIRIIYNFLLLKRVIQLNYMSYYYFFFSFPYVFALQF